jgi:hypothetical protein
MLEPTTQPYENWEEGLSAGRIVVTSVLRRTVPAVLDPEITLSGLLSRPIEP